MPDADIFKTELLNYLTEMNGAIRAKECMHSKVLSPRRQKTSDPKPHNLFSFFYLLK
jgi:hypothetical protein